MAQDGPIEPTSPHKVPNAQTRAAMGEAEEIVAARRACGSAGSVLPPIRTDQEHQTALKVAKVLFDLPEEPSPDSAVGVLFAALLAQIQAYERALLET
jgi:hypothetical protein